MYPRILKLALVLAAMVSGGAPCRLESQLTTAGRVALGAFIPTGDDADVAETSVALQLTGDVQMVGRLGAEAEVSWIPINLASTTIPAGNLIEARQISAVAGLRVLTQALALTDHQPAAYLSARIGFSRITVRADTTTSVPGWIGSTVDGSQNLPPFSFPIRATENAFVISPRAGFLLRPSAKTMVDISITPSFLFDGGEVTTQVIATIGFGMLGSLD
jgi:hypothetical protein